MRGSLFRPARAILSIFGKYKFETGIARGMPRKPDILSAFQAPDQEVYPYLSVRLRN
jgi:hypothetical protein